MLKGFRAPDVSPMTSASNDTASISGKFIAQVYAPAVQAQAPHAAFHPNMLLVRWEIAFRARDWSSASVIAADVMDALPAEPIGWIYRAFAQQQMGQLAEARQTLLAGARRFPNDWRIAYNLACYNAQVGDIAGAWNWLERAAELGDAAIIKSCAASEPSLKPLWEVSGLKPKPGLHQSVAAESESIQSAFAA